MNATVKFYTAFSLALAIVIAVSFAVGYRAGYGHAVRTQTVSLQHRTTAHGTPAP